jgi:hypothetical protein
VNSRWGYDWIAGNWSKLGITLDPTTVKNILERHGIPPAPRRGRSTWRTFLNHYKEQMLACDFLTVETPGLRTVYILFFIELPRRVHFAGWRLIPIGPGHPAGASVNLGTPGSSAGRQAHAFPDP